MTKAYALLIAITTAATVTACLWDRDTIAQEASGLPGFVEAVTGRIDRNPDLFYEMRLDRVTKEIKEDPTILSLYDDAAVASDRIGQSSIALEWMARKKQYMDAGEPTEDDLYRYHANLGTFYAHAWLRSEERNPQILNQAAKEIEAALNINPDAHFGREEVQLHLIRAVQTELDRESIEYRSEVTTFVNSWNELIETEGRDRVIEGLVGLMVLGAAWESPDVIWMLGAAVAQDDGVLGQLAAWRKDELEDNGAPSLFKGGELVTRLGATQGLEADRYNAVEETYKALRASADQYRENRDAFMMQKLQQGDHPDTHEDFWEGYEPTPMPDLGTLDPNTATTQEDTESAPLTTAAIAGVILLILAPIILFFVLRKKPA